LRVHARKSPLTKSIGEGFNLWLFPPNNGSTSLCETYPAVTVDTAVCTRLSRCQSLSLRGLTMRIAMCPSDGAETGAGAVSFKMATAPPLTALSWMCPIISATCRSVKQHRRPTGLTATKVGPIVILQVVSSRSLTCR